MVTVAPATGWPAAFTTTPVTPDEVTFCAITTVGEAASNDAIANGSIPLRILLVMVSTFGLQREEENVRDAMSRADVPTCCADATPDKSTQTAIYPFGICR